jgi:hypothetical protein
MTWNPKPPPSPSVFPEFSQSELWAIANTQLAGLPSIHKAVCAAVHSYADHIRSGKIKAKRGADPLAEACRMLATKCEREVPTARITRP